MYTAAACSTGASVYSGNATPSPSPRKYLFAASCPRVRTIMASISFLFCSRVTTILHRGQPRGMQMMVLASGFSSFTSKPSESSTSKS